ncbi:MAG: dTDP-glucose 4,6-dehydratase, partial [Acidobacteria bacterium]|nr:dTDP-glucose 4,6-dehydratase [Acidobacteriota bacterium]
MRKILITGGAGFIGSNFIHYLLSRYKDIEVVNLDKLTYAGNLDNLKDVADDPRYRFVKGDICDRKIVSEVISGCELVVHFAAETHVDRSILEAGSFITTDVYGTYVLLEEAKKAGVKRFIHISTDEVYGSVEEGFSREDDPLKPSNPYSASKAGADRLAYSFFVTYHLPVIIVRASNNFGPYQYPEKIIPLFITNAIDDLILPLYGDGKNIRDWLYVEDHCRAIDLLIEKGKEGEVYNVGGGNLLPNIELTRRILAILGKPETLIRYVADRPGHDRRYA